MRIVIIIFALIVLAVYISVLVDFLIKQIRLYLKFQSENRCLADWRATLTKGMLVSINGDDAVPRTIVAIHNSIIQVVSKTGNLSGHHISAIYPITSDYGTIN